MRIKYVASVLSRLIEINSKEKIESVWLSHAEFEEAQKDAENSRMINNYDGANFEVKGQGFSVHYDPTQD